MFRFTFVHDLYLKHSGLAPTVRKFADYREMFEDYSHYRDPLICNETLSFVVFINVSPADMSL